MPTKKQLFARWRTDMLFGDHGHREENYIGPKTQTHKGFTGNKIGTISYNPETNDLKVDFYTSLNDSEQDSLTKPLH